MEISNTDAKGCSDPRLAIGLQLQSSLGNQRQTQSPWKGYLAVYGDTVPIADHRESILLGVEVESLVIPHLVLAEQEDAENWLFFSVMLKGTLVYPFKGIVSDGDPGIENVVQLVYPGISHQLCVKHFGDGLHYHLRYQFSFGYGTWRGVQRFEEAVISSFYAQNLQEAKQLLEAIRADPGFWWVHLEDGLALLERNYGRLTQQFLHPGLPRTSNVTEGVICKLDRRLIVMDSFSSHRRA
jgi:hypothetical protein